MCTRSTWVEVITLLYHICYAMIEPSIKVHIYESLCSVGNYSTDCSTLTSKDKTSVMLEDAIQKYAANSLVYLKLLRSLPALLMIIFCGAWSDNIGRKVSLGGFYSHVYCIRFKERVRVIDYWQLCWLRSYIVVYNIEK